MVARSPRFDHLLALLVALITAGAVWHWQRFPHDHGIPRVVVHAVVPHDDLYSVFLDIGKGYSPDLVVDLPVQTSDTSQTLEFELPPGTTTLRGLRFDPGDHSKQITITSIELHGPYDALEWNGAQIVSQFTQEHSVDATVASGATHLTCTGRDPWIATANDLSIASAQVLSDHPPVIRAFLMALAALATTLLVLLILGRAVLRLRSLHWREPIAPSRLLLVLLCVDAFVLLTVYGVTHRIRERPHGLHLRFEVIYGREDLFQLFYGEHPHYFDQMRSVYARTVASPAPQWVDFELPPDTLPEFLRFDPGVLQDSAVIQRAELTLGASHIPINKRALYRSIGEISDLDTAMVAGQGLTLRPRGPDPFVHFRLDLRERAATLDPNEGLAVLPILAALLAVVLAHAGLSRSERLRLAVEGASARDLRLAVSFLALLDLPLLVEFHPGLRPGQSFSEKRRMAELPDLELRTLAAYPAQFDAWYRDHFGFRAELFRWNSWLHVFVINTSPLPEKLVVGKHGWLYQYDPLLDDNYRGKPLFSIEDMERLRKQCEEHQRWLAARGIRYYLMIAPMSSTINPEHLPGRFHWNGKAQWAARLKAYFDRYSTVPVIDPTPQLLEAKKEKPVYFKTDIHWNPYGAYQGYQALIDRIREDDQHVPPPWQLKDLQFKNDTNEQADIAHMLGLGDVLTRVEPIIVPLRKRKASFHDFPDLSASNYFLDRPQTFTQPDSTLPRLLMFHDSFGLYLKPLLNEHFSRATYVWYPLFLPDVVTEEKPDIVVHELIERFLVNLPKDTVRPTR